MKAIKKLFLLIPLFTCSILVSQSLENYSLEANYFYGTFLRHNKNVAHLVVAHPEGFAFSLNKKTFGEQTWHQLYNYPEWGITVLYQNFNNPILDYNFGVYGHINFFFLKRKLQFKLAQGIAYNNNPFDLQDNFKNIAYGSHLLASTYLGFNYHQNIITNNWYLTTGVSFIHYSNGAIKTPNSGTNVFAFNLGIKYQDRFHTSTSYTNDSILSKNYKEPIKFNVIFRSGVNQSDFFNLGQHPFYTFTGYVDKRINYKSTFQFGAEYFISPFIKSEIEYLKASFPNRVEGNPDYKRASFIVGHELRLGKFAIPTQIGYYFYRPYAYETEIYSRIGVQYYVNKKLFAVATVKTHAANAENIDFGIGIRL